VKSKNKYHVLDEPGFVGIQDKRPDAQIKMDIELTTQYIKAIKAQKKVASSTKK
jgi:hypothetical protein